MKSAEKWYDYRLIAIDGSRLSLPYSEELHKEFGPHKINQNDKKVVIAHISEAYDPLNKITVDATIEHYNTSEYQMLFQHLQYLGKGDLTIFDRHYPAFWLYKLLLSKGIEFCMRKLSGGREKFIKEFVKSGEKTESC